MTTTNLLRDVAYGVATLLLAWHAGQRVLRSIDLRNDSVTLLEALNARITISHSPLLDRADRLLLPLDGRPLTPSDEARQTLVLVLAGASLRSLEAAPAWRDILAGLPRSAYTTVWVVVDQRTPIADSLAGWSAPPGDRMRLLQIRSVPEFVTATGLASVPSTLLFRDSVLLLMAAGPMGQREVKLFLDYLGHPERPALSNPLVGDNRTDLLDAPAAGPGGGP